MMAFSSMLCTHVNRFVHILSFLSLLQQLGHASQYHDEPEKVFHFLSVKTHWIIRLMPRLTSPSGQR